MSSGSNCAERAVEPTRSQNITVSWRRSALSRGVVWDEAGGPAGGGPRRPPGARRGSAQSRGRAEDLAAMPEEDAEFLEILVRQIANDAKVDGVLDETLGVL